MANINFKKGLLAALPSAYSEGTFYVTTDERGLYLDISGSERIRFGDFQEFATLDALKANTNPSTSALYYISDMNCLAKWNGAEYIQINLDTGATSFEVVGDGNAITGVSYDAVTRKLTLTKGETFATMEYVGEIPEGYTETNIIAYINKKAEETLNAASGGSSESAASVLAALNTYKAATDPRLEALEAVDHEHANQAELDLIESGDKAKWDAMEQNAKDYADGKIAEEVARAEAAEKANTDAAKAADDKAVAAQNDVDALELKVGEVPEDKTVVQMIEEAQEAATYDDTALAGRVTAVEGNVSTLVGDDAGKSARTIANEELAKQLIGDSAKESLDTLEEIAAWIQAHPDDASAMNAAIVALQTKVDTGDKNVSVYVADAISALNIGNYALAADLTALAARVEALEAKDHEHANADVLNGITAEKVAAWDAAEQNAIGKANELNTAMDTRMQAVEANAHEHANSAELEKIVDGDVAKWNAAQANAEATAAAALASAKTELEGKITAETERAEAAEAQALVDAKAYADSLVLTWGSF